MKSLALAVLWSAALTAPAYAHDERLPPPAFLFDGIIQDRDVGLVFGYLREALDAATQGREAPPPVALEQRASEIGEEMKRRGAVAARIFIDVIEKIVRESMRERPPPPALPPSPSSRGI